MIDSQIHIVGKQIIHLEVDGMADVDHITNMVLEDVSNAINKSANAFLNQLLPSSSNLRINELILDLGVIPENQLGEAFEEYVYRTFKEGLLGKIRKEHLIIENSAETSNKTILKIWNYFIQKGFFPWWSPIQTVDELELNMLKVIETNNAHIASFSKVIKENSNYFLRFHFQFSASFVTRYLETTPIENEVLKKLMKELNLMATHKIFVDTFSSKVNKEELIKLQFVILSSSSIKSIFSKEQKTWKKLFSFIFSYEAKEDFSDFKKWFIKHAEFLKLVSQMYPEAQPVFKKGYFEYLKNTIEISKNREESYPQGKKTFHSSKNTEFDKDDCSSDVNENSFSSKRKPYTASSLKASKTQDFSKLNSNGNDEIFIVAAGLIILHPYLLQLFTQLEFLKNGKFMNSQMQNRAIHLLGFIATGETHLSEDKLIMPKILCGIDINTPVKRRLKLKKKEKMEADKMLEIVVSHWKALGNTSINTFRDSFLKRDGKLSLEDKGWDLLVEQKSIDILLCKIPWGITPIKLPWMHKLLYVTWT
nr:contractile injection system tape measure protein [uncultured Psychroserpens sp.]